MTDIYSPEKRSWIMSRVRGQNTSSELLVFNHLRKNRIYFQKHYRKVVGTPDIALPRKKICVFIDGDFWHGRHVKSISKLTPLWKSKIAANVARDRRNKKKLRQAGWMVLRVWESDLKKNPTRELDKVVTFLKVE